MELLGHLGGADAQMDALMEQMLGGVGRSAAPEPRGGGGGGAGEVSRRGGRPEAACSGEADARSARAACGAAAGRVPRRLLDASSAAAVALACVCPRGAGGWCGTGAAEEAARLRAVSRLSKAFEEVCGGEALLGKRWASHFEQWLFAARAACDRASSRQRKGEELCDAVIPYSDAAQADGELQRKLQAAGLPKAAARQKCAALGKAAVAAARRVATDVAAAAGSRKRVTVASVEGCAAPGKLRLSLGKAAVEARADHYAKLRSLHAIASAATGRRSPDAAFATDAFCLLARYSAACGAQLRGGGFHAAIHGECFDALAADFGVAMECFASPLNCRWPRFCSQFPDVDRYAQCSTKARPESKQAMPFGANCIESMTMINIHHYRPELSVAGAARCRYTSCTTLNRRKKRRRACSLQVQGVLTATHCLLATNHFCRPFGSVGSFFDESGSGYNFSEGSYEANPPFDEGVVRRMARRMGRLLENAQDAGRRLCFVVIIPHWPDKSEGWTTLRMSRHLRRHVQIPLREHGYFEGAQHNKLKSQYRVASFDTSVFFLMTDAAHDKWPVTDEKIERLKKAFRPKHKDDPSGEEGGAAGAAAAPQPRKQKPAKRRKVVG